MSTATAILFPGQGSQTADMRDVVARERPDLLERVIAAVGEDPFPAGRQTGTHFAQPAIFCASLAGWHALGSPEGGLDGRSFPRRAGRAGRRRGPGRGVTASSWSRCGAG